MKQTLHRLLWLMLFTFGLTSLTGCAGGKSIYDYTRNVDGSVSLHIASVNEVEQLFVSYNKDTGELEINLGGLTKKSEVETVIQGFENVTGNIVKILNPLSTVDDN